MVGHSFSYFCSRLLTTHGKCSYFWTSTSSNSCFLPKYSKRNKTHFIESEVNLDLIGIESSIQWIIITLRILEVLLRFWGIFLPFSLEFHRIMGNIKEFLITSKDELARKIFKSWEFNEHNLIFEIQSQSGNKFSPDHLSFYPLQETSFITLHSVLINRNF